MLLSVFVPLSLVLACAAVLAGRHSRPWNGPPSPVPPGERILAVIRPDAEVGLLLCALGVAGAGLLLSLGGAIFGRSALAPLGLALAFVVVPVVADWLTMLRRAWIVTDRRLIAGHALEVPLADLTRLRILPLGVEVQARGDRLLRLPALVNPGPAARAIQAAALAHQGREQAPITDFPRRVPAL